jgi:hypothetical protein
MPFLATIEIEDGDVFLLRNVLTSERIQEAEVVYYYHTLLGFPTFRIKMQQREVPNTFTLSLLGSKGGEVPLHFPAHDYQTPEAGLAKYYQLIERVCAMAVAQEECGIQEPRKMDSEPTHTFHPSPQPSKYASWVEEVLASLRKHEEVEVLPEEDMTIAWIFTPVLQDIRDTRGSRIITDPVVGKQWSSQLGTDLYPDLVVRRRLSTVDWNFQHETSNVLARAAIEWYIQAQLVGPPTDGISPWIQRADEELGAVFEPFKRLGPRQAFEYQSGPQRKERVHPLMTLLRKLEGDHIVSVFSYPDEEAVICQLSKPSWEKYLKHVFRMYGIGTETMESHWAPVNELVEMWIRGNHGVRMNQPALFTTWQHVWEVLLDHKPCPERFHLFLRTLDAHNPIVALGMGNTEKYELAAAWVKVYVETEMITDSTSKISATQFYANSREWCLKYTPLSVLDNAFKAPHIGPTMTTLGYPCQRTKRGRMLAGIRYRNPSPLAVQVEEEEEVPSVLSYMKQTTGEGIQILTGTEIHLGNL